MSFQRIRWIIVALSILIAIPAPLLARQATPDAPEGTKLYINHASRLTAWIPETWTYVPDDFGYGDESGSIESQPLGGSTLAEACEELETHAPADKELSRSDVQWRDEPACRFEIAATASDPAGIAIVIPHPEPFTVMGIPFSFVTIAVDADHFDEIMSTVSFDLSALTGPQIAHSILDVVEETSLRARDIDWNALRDAANALGPDDSAYGFIRDELLAALKKSGDFHSFLIPPVAAGQPGQHPGGHMDIPTGDTRGDLGYINVPGVLINPDAHQYVDAGLETIGHLGEQHVCGWIIDLRQNTGGSANLMLQAITPLLPEGHLVGYRDGADDETWISRDGDQILYGEQVWSLLETAPVPALDNPDAPIAVLISNNTISAGEHTLLALMHRKNTRTFGQSTGGFTTGNSVFPLLDGSILMIESDVSLDADGNAHTGPIEPDVPIMSRASGGAHSSDETIVTAEAWLLDQPACEGTATPAG